MIDQARDQVIITLTADVPYDPTYLRILRSDRKVRRRSFVRSLAAVAAVAAVAAMAAALPEKKLKKYGIYPWIVRTVQFCRKKSYE